MQMFTIRRPPHIRVFAIDEIGLIRVIDSKRTGIPEIVDTWGDENSSPVVAVSLANSDDDPLMAIARKNNVINVIDPRDGSPLFEIESDCNDPIIGLHLFENNTVEPNSSRSCKLVTCTEKGQTGVSSYNFDGQPAVEGSNMKWSAVSAPKEMIALFSEFHETRKLSIFGGKNGVLHLCDYETGQISWTAELLDVWPSDISFVAGSFVDDGTQWVAGSDIDNVSIFDIRADHKPIQTFDLFLEKTGTDGSSIIRSIVRDTKSRMVHIGTDSGDLFSLDLNTGRRLDFEGIGYSSYRNTSPHVAPSGPVRDMAMHRAHPLIASAGDRCLDIWSSDEKRLMAKVDMYENVTHILFDYTTPKDADQSQANNDQNPSTSRVKNSLLRRSLGSS